MVTNSSICFAHYAKEDFTELFSGPSRKKMRLCEWYDTHAELSELGGCFDKVGGGEEGLKYSKLTDVLVHNVYKF
jgi:hypothetical protein